MCCVGIYWEEDGRPMAAQLPPESSLTKADETHETHTHTHHQTIKPPNHSAQPTNRQPSHPASPPPPPRAQERGRRRRGWGPVPRYPPHGRNGGGRGAGGRETETWETLCWLYSDNDVGGWMNGYCYQLSRIASLPLRLQFSCVIS